MSAPEKAQFEKEDFDPFGFVNDFLSKTMKSSDLGKNSGQGLGEEGLSKLNEQIMLQIKELEMLKEKAKEELDTCLMVNEINAENKRREQDQILEQNEELREKCLDLEVQLTRFSEYTADLAQTLSNLDSEKEQHIVTAELIKHFLVLNQSESELQANPQDLEISRNFYGEAGFAEPAFSQTAYYIYLLYRVANSLTSQAQYQVAISNINMLYEKARKMLMHNFQNAFWNSEFSGVKNVLQLIEKYELLQDVSNFYIENSLSELKTDLQYENKEFAINVKNIAALYFSILRVFKKVFTVKQGSEISVTTSILFGTDDRREGLRHEKLKCEIFEIFGEKGVEVMKSFVSVTFEKYVAETLKVLFQHSKGNYELYLNYYEYLLTNTRKLVDDIGKIPSPVSSTLTEICNSYFTTLFDDLQNNYFDYEVKFLDEKLTRNISFIMEEIKEGEGKALLLSAQKENEVKEQNEGAQWSKYLEKTILDEKGERKYKISKEQMQKRVNLLKDILLQEWMEEIFAATQASLNRCSKISKPESKKSNVFYLLDRFIIAFGKILVESLIQYTSDIIPSLNRKTRLNEGFFEIVSKLNVLIQRMELHYTQAVSGFHRIGPDFEALIAKKSQVVNKLENSINKSIQIALASLFVNCNRILAEKQKPKEFALAKEAPVPEKSSDACKEFISFLSPFVKSIKLFANIGMKSRILSSIAAQLTTILLEHFKHYKITSRGALALEFDIKAYNNFVAEFEDPVLNKEFEVIRFIGGLFKQKNEEVKKYVEKNEVAKAIPSDVLEFYLKKKTSES